MSEWRYASGFPVPLVLVPFKQGHCYIQPMHFLHKIYTNSELYSKKVLFYHLHSAIISLSLFDIS